MIQNNRYEIREKLMIHFYYQQKNNYETIWLNKLQYSSFVVVKYINNLHENSN